MPVSLCCGRMNSEGQGTPRHPEHGRPPSAPWDPGLSDSRNVTVIGMTRLLVSAAVSSSDVLHWDSGTLFSEKNKAESPGKSDFRAAHPPRDEGKVLRYKTEWPYSIRHWPL